jgi:xylulokinase
MNLRLSGRFVATPDSILTSWVTDNRDSAKVKYSPALLKNCGIDADKFPEIMPCDSVIGELKAEVAESLGLKPGVKVVAGAIDTTSAAIGSGAVGDYEGHLCIGTSSWIAAHVPFKKTDIVSSLASVPCAIPGKFLMIIMQTTAGGNLTFLRDKILYHKDELMSEEHVPDVYRIMDRIAERVPAGSHGVIYTPWIYGERSPVEDSHVRASIFNVSLENNREDLIRAFLEGVALNTRWMLAPAEKFLGRKLETLNIVGGGARSSVWCQIFADVLNLTIRQARDPIEVNARGAAFIAAEALGLLQFSDLQKQVEFEAVYTPNPANREVYDRTFAEFVTYYNQTKDIYKRLNG